MWTKLKSSRIVFVLWFVIGVALFVGGVYAGAIFSFISGLILLPQTGPLAAVLFSIFLGLVGGVTGGFAAGQGSLAGAGVGALGRILLVFWSDTIAHLSYNRPSFEPKGVLDLAMLVSFVVASSGGGAIGGYVRRRAG